MLVNANERERAALARLIHDDLAQKLTLATMELAMWRTDLEHGTTAPAAEVAEKIDHLSTILNGAIAAARAVTSSLRPRTFDSFGLIATIESVATAFKSRTGVICRVQAETNDLCVCPDLAIQLVRIVELFLAQPAAATWGCASIRIREHKGGIELAFSIAGPTPELPPEAAARVDVFGGKTRQARGRLIIWFRP